MLSMKSNMRSGYGAWLIYLAPVSLAIWFVVSYGVNVPFMDEWSMAFMFHTVKHHSSNLADILWTPNNEHRVVVPRLIILALTSLGNWNSKVEMFVTLAIAIALFLGLVRLAHETYRSEVGDARLLKVSVTVSGLLLFSFVHYDTWLWGFQMAFVLPLTFTVFAMCVLCSSRGESPIGLAWIALFCLAASLSAAHGLLSWPVILICALLQSRERKSLLRVSIPLSSLFLLTVFLYTRGAIPVITDRSFVFKQPRAGASFFLALIGAPLAQDLPLPPERVADWIGLAVLSAFVAGVCAAFYRRRIPQVAPWVSLGCLALGFCAMTTYSRAVWGLWVASTQSRYMICTVLLTIATILLLQSLGFSKPSYRVLFLSGVVGVGLIELSTDANLLTKGEELHKLRRDAALYLEIEKYIDPSTDESERSLLAPLFPFKPFVKFIRTPAELSHELGLLNIIDQAVFFDPAPAFCGCLDSPVTENEGVLKIGSGDLQVSGWSVIADQHRVPQIVMFSTGRRSFVSGTRVGTVERPDVAALLNVPGYVRSGWRTSIPGEFLPTGEFQLKAWAYDSRQRRFLRLLDCRGPKRIIKTID
jgi:hypothetical protein